MFRTVPLSIKSFFTVHTTMVYVIHIWWLLRAECCSQQSPNLCVCVCVCVCVQWKTPDDGQRNCPKHVASYSKNKFEKLVHLVGFIIRIYHNARSSERQICYFLFTKQKGNAELNVKVPPCILVSFFFFFLNIIPIYNWDSILCSLFNFLNLQTSWNSIGLVQSKI